MNKDSNDKALRAMAADLDAYSFNIPEGYVLVPLGAEPDETKFRLMVEDIWAFHKAMDEAGAPREANGQTLSMYGRALLWKVSQVDRALACMRTSVRVAMGESE